MAEEIKKKRVRTPFDPETMGFGKHKYEYIDKDNLDTNAMTEPPGGIRTRDFNVAFNKRQPGTDMDIDLLSRIGAVFETNAPGYEGLWVVAGVPALRSAVMLAVCRRAEDKEGKCDMTQPPVEISAVALGAVPDRFTNLYSEVTTKWVGGKHSATGADRERLTKLT